MVRGLRELVTVSPPTLDRTAFAEVDRELAGLHAGYERAWLMARFAEGLQIRMLDGPQSGLVLFQPGRLSWHPIRGLDDAIVVHDLRVAEGPKARTAARQLWAGVEDFARFYGFAAIYAVFGNRSRMIRPEVAPPRGWMCLDQGPGEARLMAQVLTGPLPLPQFPTDWAARAASLGPGVVVQTTGECAGEVARIARLERMAARRGGALRVDRLTAPHLSQHRAVGPCPIFSVVVDGQWRGGTELSDEEILGFLPE